MMPLYPTRYFASKHKLGDEVCVRVFGGYTLMSRADYRVWLNQKQEVILVTKVYAVFLGETFLKCFGTRLEADLLSFGLKSWIIDHDMDPDIVRIKEEVMS